MKKVLVVLGSIFFLCAAVLGIFYSARLLEPPFFRRAAATDKATQERLTYEEQLDVIRQKQIDRSLISMGLEFTNSDIRCRYDESTDRCTYNIITPAFNRSLIDSAVEGDRSSITLWNNLLFRFKAVQKGVQRSFIDKDLDTGVVLNLVNPDNSGEVFLSVSNGIDGLDVVHGVDLLHPETRQVKSSVEAVDVSSNKETTETVTAVESVVPEADSGQNETVVFDGTERIMLVSVSHSMPDNSEVGHEWSYQYEINGVPIANEYDLTVGDSMSLTATIVESDGVPDEGSNSVTHVVTQDDLINGFEESFEVAVTENGGRYRGESAYFSVTFSFTAK